MSIDLSTLRESELRSFSYEKTLDVILALEDEKPLSITRIDAMEVLEGYYIFVTIIEQRISNNEFPELKATAKKRDRDLLQSRLKLLENTFYFSLDIHNRWKTQTEQIDQIKGKNDELSRKITEETDKIGEVVDSAIDKINNNEHNILTHVLTLFGIFSAIITIIMSVVVTSTSWLNNATGASAILAFAIPNVVVLISIIVLVLLIYIYNNTGLFFQKKNQAGKSNCRATSVAVISVILLIIIGLSGVLAWCAVKYTVPVKNPHMRYVISQADYTIVEDNNSDADNKAEKCIGYFEFTFEGVNYRFLFDEKLIHDGNLYYCQEHNQLE